MCDDVFFAGVVFNFETQRSGKGVEAFRISTESYPIGLIGDDHRISLYHQPQCEQTCLKYTTKNHGEVVTPCFVACF